DPLNAFGGLAGQLPNQDEEISSLLHDVLLRWQYPHHLSLLESLVQQLPSFCMKEFVIDAMDVKKMGTGLNATYTVQPVKLELLAHVILAVQQILSSLSELRGIPPRQAFRVDPSYVFICSLEGEPSPSCLELMWETLVQRLLRSYENIEAQLHTLYCFFTEPDARLSQISFDSTEGELRS
ncbi:hypothetical protein BDN71DRAFT_1357014, partial [Pleurotus eryngii]